MTYHYAFLSACIGIGAYLVTAGVAYLGSRARQWARYHDAHERTVDLAHEVVRAHAYVMAAEAALAREVERTPDVERRRFASWAREMAGGLPPLLLAQLRRFGLAEPPAMMAKVPLSARDAAAVHGWVPLCDDARAVMLAENVAAEVPAATADEDAWGGEG